MDHSNVIQGFIWFHRDLRVQDNECVSFALRAGGVWQAIRVRSDEYHPAQKKFFNECDDDLREALATIGIHYQTIESKDLTAWLQQASRDFPNATWLHSRVYNAWEQVRIGRLKQYFPISQIHEFDQGTLHQEEDLPFKLVDLPKTFTPFQKALRSPPNLQQFQFFELETQALLKPSGFDEKFRGGEKQAWAHFADYAYHSQAVSHYDLTRNGMLNWHDSSKLAPYLAWGCLSVKRVAHELLHLKKVTDVREEAINTLIYELEWRDYFKFISLKYGEKIFEIGGIRSQSKQFENDQQSFDRWIAGETGQDFVDANMRELACTGWMSNRGRQNVASFLAKTLKVNWTWGAQWFAKNLIDYDVESNWGNWMYLAGVGNDPRDRVFNPGLQANQYDSEGAYRKRWLTDGG